MTTLNDYIFVTRRLLHDANANFWTDQELTIDINGARQRLVRDTGALRRLQTSTVTQGKEVYNFADLPEGDQTMDVLTINLYWGTTRVPLMYKPWTQFNAELRYYQSYIGQPVAFSLYGTNSFYIGPLPDQTYTIELDTVIRPVDMVNLSDVEVIKDPWTEPVPYYAAYTAKFKEQSYGEAEIFRQQYIQKCQNLLATTFTRRMPMPYSQAY